MSSTPLHQRCDELTPEEAAGTEPQMQQVLLTPHGPSLHLPEALFSEGDEWFIRQRQAAAATTSCSSSADPRGCGSSQPSSEGIQRDNVNRTGAGPPPASSAPLSDLDHWFQQQHLLRYGPEVPIPPLEYKRSETPHRTHHEHQRGLDAETQHQQAWLHQTEALRQRPESMAQLAAMVNLQFQMTQASMFPDSLQEDAQREKLALLAALQKWQVRTGNLHSKS